MKIGDTAITKKYIGDTEVTKRYFGDEVLTGGFSLFGHSSNTLYFDPSSASNIKNDEDLESYAILPDLINGSNSLVQPNKPLQPVVSAQDAMDFNDLSDRKITFDNPDVIANGHGYYFGANITPVTGTNRTLFYVSENSGSSASRALIYITSSRYLGIKLDSNDGNSPDWIGYATNKLVNGVKVTIEVNLIADGSTTNPLKIWINGNEETLISEDTSAITIPTSAPNYAYIGNRYSSTESFNGDIEEVILENANIEHDSALRVGFGAFLNTQRTA